MNIDSTDTGEHRVWYSRHWEIGARQQLKPRYITRIPFNCNYSRARFHTRSNPSADKLADRSIVNAKWNEMRIVRARDAISRRGFIHAISLLFRRLSNQRGVLYKKKKNARALAAWKRDPTRVCPRNVGRRSIARRTRSRGLHSPKNPSDEKSSGLNNPKAQESGQTPGERWKFHPDRHLYSSGQNHYHFPSPPPSPSSKEL